MTSINPISSLPYSYDYTASHETLRRRLSQTQPFFEESADYALYFFLPEIVVRVRDEYVVCDASCLIGEIGGNLGFFLGGSILALLDLIVMPLAEDSKWVKKFF